MGIGVVWGCGVGGSISVLCMMVVILLSLVCSILIWVCSRLFLFRSW